MPLITLIVKAVFHVIHVAVVLNNLCHALHNFVSTNIFCVTRGRHIFLCLSYIFSVAFTGKERELLVLFCFV